MAHDRGEAIRLAARVTEVSDPPPGMWAVTIDGVQSARVTTGWFAVEHDGHRVRVDVDDHARIVGTHSFDHKGAWSELHHKTWLPADHVPAFTAARVVGTALAFGDPVELYGEVIEREQGAADYREQAPSSLRRVCASLVARGDDATAALDKALALAHPPAKRKAKAPRKPSPADTDPGNPRQRGNSDLRFLTGASAAAIAAAAATYFIWHVATIALCLAAIAFVLRPIPEPRALRPKSEVDHRWPVELVEFLLPLGYLAAMLGLLPETGVGVMRYVGAGFFAVLIPIEIVRFLRVRPYRRIVRAPAWDGKPADTARIAGVVRDPTPVTIGSTQSAIGRTTTYGGRTSDESAPKKTQFHGDGTFVVETGAGDIEIDPNQIVWATTVVAAPDDTFFSFDVVETIPVGGKVVAVGAVIDGKLRAQRTLPAVVFATSRHGDPLGMARTYASSRLVSLVGVLAIAALYAVICVRG